MNSRFNIPTFQPDTVVVDTPSISMGEIIRDTVTSDDVVLQESQDSVLSITATSQDSVVPENQKGQTPQKTIPVIKTQEPAASLPVIESPSEVVQKPQKLNDSPNYLQRIPDYSVKNTVRSDFLSGTNQTQTVAVQEPIPLSKPVPDWAMGIIILSSFFLIWVRTAYYKHMSLILKSFGNYQFSVKLFKDSSQIYKQVSYLLNINSAIVVGLFLFMVYVHLAGSHHRPPDIINYLVIPAFLLVLYVLQYAGYYLLGLFFEQPEPYMEYTHHTYTLAKILGILLLPLVVIVAYVPVEIRPLFLWGGVIILGIFYLKRLLRGVKIIFNHHAFKFQWILYFCTLEILPVLIIIKLAISLI